MNKKENETKENALQSFHTKANCYNEIKTTLLLWEFYKNKEIPTQH